MIAKIAKFFSYRLSPPLSADSIVSEKGQGDDHSVLKFTRHCRTGFYMLEYRFNSQVSGGTGQLSALGDAGFPLQTLPLPSARLNKRIIYIAAATKAWRLSVLDAEGQPIPLSQQDCEYLRFVPLRNSFAVNRMLRRTGVPFEMVKQRARKSGQSFGAHLYQLYDRSFVRGVEEHYQRWIDYVEGGRVQVSAVDADGAQQNSSDCYYFCAPGYCMTPEVKALLAKALQDVPKARLVYTDEDLLDANKLRKRPWFKQSWNPDLFLAQDYVSACYACRRDWYEMHSDVFQRLGSRLALSQLLPQMDADAVLHVPQVLAHRLESAVDMDETGQPEWVSRRSAVLREALPDGVKLESSLLPGSLRVRYPLPESVPLVSLLIPTRDGLSVLKPCVESILSKTIYPNYEILILDNQSGEPETLEWLESIVQDARVRVLKYDKPFNYSAINNFGARHAQGSVIGLINNDVEVISPDWLVEMISQAMRPEIGCVGAKLYYSNGQIQHGGVILGLGDVAGHAHRFLARDDDGYHGRLKLVQNYSAVTAACLLVRREIYEKVEGLEEKHLTVAYNDVDFCLRVREAGYRNLWTPYAELYHHESISRGEDDTPVKKARYQKEVAYMQKTWGEQLANDPCYNPNLCRRREDFSLPDVLF